MGNFYVNYTLRGPTPAEVAKVLARRRARVTPVHKNSVVVFDAASDGQDQREIAKLSAKLSKKFACPLLTVLNHDDDILWYQLHMNGKLVDEYDSTPGYFDPKATQSDPAGGDAAELCAAFGGDPAEVENVLRESSDSSQKYVFAVDRHADLVDALGISEYAVGTSYESFDNDELPEGLALNDVIEVTSAASRSSRRPRPAMSREEAMISALFQAAGADDVATIRRLVEQEGVNSQVVSQAGHTPLHNACRCSKAEAAAILIQLGADPNQRYNYHSISAGLQSGRTALMYAGSATIVKLLLESGADPNAEDAVGFTPLMQASIRRDPEAIKSLLAAGANILATTKPAAGKTGKTARQLAESWLDFYAKLPPDSDVAAMIEKTNQTVKFLAEAEQRVDRH